MDTAKLLLTVNETVRVTGIGRSTLYTLISSGKLPAVKVGKRTFFRPDDLKAFAENCTAYTARAA